MKHRDCTDIRRKQVQKNFVQYRYSSRKQHKETTYRRELHVFVHHVSVPGFRATMLATVHPLEMMNSQGLTDRLKWCGQFSI